MKTHEDLLKVTTEQDRQNFVISAINQHKASPLYREAVIAHDYFRRRNVTIREYQKILYKLTGEAIIDNYSANYKFTNAFFQIFVRQQNSHLLGNGVTFNDDSTKEKLGGQEFDNQLIKAGEYALWGGVSFGFFNLDHVDVFKITEFVPLIGEEDGALHAGIRFWQIDPKKPLRATLYEEDGYTEYKWHEGECTILHPKRTYRERVAVTKADGVEILDGKNYPSFPIVPLWANEERQTELTGLREKIDGYDLIQSGMANDLEDVAEVYWILQNAGGMDDLDLARFIERVKTTRVAQTDDAVQAEAHTLDVPYQARMTALQDLRDSLYRDAMALDTDKISAGNITATAIQAAYENLTLKCDAYEMCVTDFIRGLLKLIGVDDSPVYKRSKLLNRAEDTQMVLSAAQYLDQQTILEKLPFINQDEIDDIMDRLVDEEAERYEEAEEPAEDLTAETEAIDGGMLEEYGNEVLTMLEELMEEM